MLTFTLTVAIVMAMGKGSSKQA